MRPKILILDEPTAGLDPKGRDEMLDNISRLHKTRNITVILVSHSMEDVARVCDSVIVMKDGTVAMQGSIREVFSKGEELEKMNLSVPQITKLILKLRDMGYPLPKDIFTTEDAHRHLIALMKGTKQ